MSFLNGRQIISIQRQIQRMKMKWPSFVVFHQKAHRVTWRGTLRPTDISQDYKIEIVHRQNERPIIKILSPKLELAANATKLPHVYEDDHLCLYYPRYGEWTHEDFISDTLVPWISLWLVFYEYWLLTGEWKGGGKHPRVRERSRRRAQQTVRSKVTDVNGDDNAHGN